MDGRRLLRPNMPPIASAIAHGSYCFPPMNRPSTERIRLICAGREHCLPGYHVSRSNFPCLVTEFVVDGKGKFRVDHSERELYAGMIFTYGLDREHDVWADPIQPLKKYFVSYSLQDDQLARTWSLPRSGDSSFTLELSSIQMLFEELIREGRRGGLLHESITAHYLWLILLKAVEAAEPALVGNPSANGGVISYERALACIEQRFLEINSLADLSNAIGLDATYICRLFKRFGRETPQQCITRFKLNRAAELLLDPSKSIKQIAYEVGYNDPFYFSRQFKKRFGYAPNEFRGLMRANVADARMEGERRAADGHDERYLKL